ncbi:hypothetical protein WS52_02420 [Burkholderia territorii]|nr:hypothetical protein WS52_02420 [Burkholderia territorii]KUZ59185.1 hypothetical protein WS53_07650 [Burkholderia territorii]
MIAKTLPDSCVGASAMATVVPNPKTTPPATAMTIGIVSRAAKAVESPAARLHSVKKVISVSSNPRRGKRAANAETTGVPTVMASVWKLTSKPAVDTEMRNARPMSAASRQRQIPWFRLRMPPTREKALLRA